MQSELAEAVANRPVSVTADLFKGKVIVDARGNEQVIDADTAMAIYEDLITNGYVKRGTLTDKYYADKANGEIKVAEEVADSRDAIIDIIDSVYDSRAMQPENARDKNVELKVDPDMTWETYYDKFYDWSTSTQISRMSSLTSFGASSEVAEVAQEFMDEKVASRFIKKAIAAGVQFTPEEIYDLSGCCDTATMNLLLESAKCHFMQEQLEDLDGVADEEVLNKVAKRNHVALYDYDEEKIEEIDFAVEEEQPPKVGFFTALALGLGIAGHMDKKKSHKHNGKCNGDCANCPPRYGYRYGRWYYGHHHSHGCEFGGNGGL